MTINERRHHPRISALNLISYNCIDETEQIVAQGMGRTLNVSEGGILLETHTPIDPKNTIALAIGLEDDLIDIKGKVVFSISGKDEKFEAGIEFLEMPESCIAMFFSFKKAWLRA